MFGRFRQVRGRLNVSLVEATRTGTRVYQSHIASLGSVAAPPSPANRVRFWISMDQRLARLSNRHAARRCRRCSVPRAGAPKYRQAAAQHLMPPRPAPRRHWRIYGNDPLPSEAEALDEPLRAELPNLSRIQERDTRLDGGVRTFLRPKLAVLVGGRLLPKGFLRCPAPS